MQLPSSSVRSLFACVRGLEPNALVAVARDFSPRIELYGSGCVVLDVGGLGRLLGDAHAIGAELARAAGGWRLSRATCYGLRATSCLSRATCDVLVRRATCACDGRRATCSCDGQRADDVLPTPRSVDSPIRVAVAPTQVSALLLSLAGPALTVVPGDSSGALAELPIGVLQQLLAAIHGVSVRRRKKTSRPPAAVRGWPSWGRSEPAFDVLQRWGVKTLGELAALPAAALSARLGELAALPAAALSARLGETGLALQQLARGCDPLPLVPDPEVPRFIERLELEWPLDALEPLSFVFARLLEPLSAALERADRGAAAIHLDLRLVDRAVHRRLLQLPAPIRDPRVLRTLLLLDLESHPPPAPIDVVVVEIDPAPGRVLQYSLLERAIPSAETIATLTARLSALVGESRCGTPTLLDSHRPDTFELRRFAPVEHGAQPAAYRPGLPAPPPDPPDRVRPCLRRFRPPLVVRVSVDRGRPVHVAIDRRGMPGGSVTQAAGPWRSSGDWWSGAARRWDRDEWDVSLGDGSVCRLVLDRDSGRWFMDGVLD